MSLQGLRRASREKLPWILGAYIVLQPLLDISTALGANVEMPITAGMMVRALFMRLTFLYTVFISDFRGKWVCLATLGALLTYLALFMGFMFSVGGLDLCIANVQEVVKTFFAPFVLVFLYAVYREYGYLITTRAIAWAGGIYASVILLAAATGTSFVSYSNSGYGFKGWFYAANEVSCIIALTSPVTIYYCLTQLPVKPRKSLQVWSSVRTWTLIGIVLVAIAFSASFIGTKIVFIITLLYCLAALLWSLIRQRQAPVSNGKLRSAVLCILLVGIVVLFFFSPLQSYLGNVYFEIMDKDSELLAVSWGEEIQRASEGTWLRGLIQNNDLVQRMDQILSRRLFSASPSVQVFLEGGLATKLLGIGYADAVTYDRSIWFMIEMDPLAILIRHGIIGFVLYIVPYLIFFVWIIVRFFQNPLRRLSNLRYCTYLYSTLSAFAIAAIAGHALVSPAVSIYVLCIGMQLWVMTKDPPQEAVLPEL